MRKIILGLVAAAAIATPLVARHRIGQRRRHARPRRHRDPVRNDNSASATDLRTVTGRSRTGVASATGTVVARDGTATLTCPRRSPGIRSRPRSTGDRSPTDGLRQHRPARPTAFTRELTCSRATGRPDALDNGQVVHERRRTVLGARQLRDLRSPRSRMVEAYSATPGCVSRTDRRFRLTRPDPDHAPSTQTARPASAGRAVPRHPKTSPWHSASPGQDPDRGRMPSPPP